MISILLGIFSAWLYSTGKIDTGTLIFYGLFMIAFAIEEHK